MKRKEPKFMQDLHRVRAKLSKEWEKMSDKEFVAHMHKIGDDFRKSSSRNFSASRPQ